MSLSLSFSQDDNKSKTDKEKEVYAQNLQERACDLEKKLLVLAKDDHKADALRVPLCEVLADCLLTSPSFAEKHDVCGRLWKHCFYTRIAHLRKCARKAANSAANANRNTTSSSTINKQSQMQQYLLQFLTEAVTLYDYLISKLQEQLATAVTTNTNSDKTRGIIACLHRLYVAYGDLHRYLQEVSKAEACYEQSANLGWGWGHSCNQLGVLCQANQRTANALYWYARSLLATVEGFPQSQANVGRLFTENRKALQEMTASEINNSNNKSLQSKRFLAEYVELQSQLLGIENASASTKDVILQMESLVDQFGTLLQNSAFGDSLLCKFVTIQAFAESVSPQSKNFTRRLVDVQLARLCSYQWGGALAERVLVGLQKCQSNNNPPSARLLAPLLLLTEYLATNTPLPLERATDETLTNADEKAQVETLLVKEQAKYFDKIAQVLNLLTVLTKAMNTNDSAIDYNDLKEYRSLRGFAPFASFVKTDTSNGMVSATEALQLLQSSSGVGATQESALTAQSSRTNASSKQSTKQADQGRIKIARFLAVGRQLVQHAEVSMDIIDGQYTFGARKEQSSRQSSQENEPFGEDEEDNDVPMMDSPEKNETLVYQENKAGGPALLVPGMLLQEQTNVPSRKDLTAEAKEHPRAMRLDPTLASPSRTGDADPMDIVQQELPEQPQTFAETSADTDSPVIAPPPGFGAPSMAASRTPALTTPQIQLGHEQNLAPSTGHMYSSNAQGSTLLESFHLYGADASAVPSANPFITQYKPPSRVAGMSSTSENDPFLSTAFSSTVPNVMLSNDHSLWMEDALHPDGTSLLDSGLLNSLWSDESTQKTRTNNPFAT